MIKAFTFVFGAFALFSVAEAFAHTNKESEKTTAKEETAAYRAPCDLDPRGC